MVTEFIFYSNSHLHDSTVWKRVRSGATAYSHHSGRRRVARNTRQGSGSVGPASRASTPRTQPKPSSVKYEESDAHQRGRSELASTADSDELNLRSGRGSHAEDVATSAGYTPHVIVCTRQTRLEKIDIVNSARTTRLCPYPVPEQPFFAPFLDFSEWFHSCETGHCGAPTDPTKCGRGYSRDGSNSPKQTPQSAPKLYHGLSVRLCPNQRTST